MKYALIIIAIVLLSAIVYVLYENAPFISFESPKPVSQTQVIVQSVDVSENSIVLHVSSTASAGLFSGYRATYDGDALYVSFMPIVVNGGSGVFTIPNTYGKIDAVYLRGTPGEPDRLIWPHNTTRFDDEPTFTPTQPKL